MGLDWFDEVPKVELHLHLEGTIPSAALWPLLSKYGGDRDVPTKEALDARFAYTDFSHFLYTWGWKNSFMREYEDFAHIAGKVADDLRSHGIRYVEAFFSPPDFAAHGHLPGRLAEAIRAGLDKVRGIRVSLVADVVRGTSLEKADALLSEMLEVRELGVIGIGLGGDEQAFPPEMYAPVYERALRCGFHVTAHAGEAAGPQSVWGAIRALGVERIGHGTRAAEDESLVEHLIESQIPLELCPGSNVRTRVVQSLSEHPVRMFYDRGVCITINTDDPKMFGTSLAGEYRSLVEVHGFTRADIRQLILQGIAASWLPDREKDDLRNAFQSSNGWGPK